MKQDFVKNYTLMPSEPMQDCPRFQLPNEQNSKHGACRHQPTLQVKIPRVQNTRLLLALCGSNNTVFCASLIFVAYCPEVEGFNEVVGEEKSNITGQRVDSNSSQLVDSFGSMIVD